MTHPHPRQPITCTQQEPYTPQDLPTFLHIMLFGFRMHLSRKTGHLAPLHPQQLEGLLFPLPSPPWTSRSCGSRWPEL